MPPRDYRGAGTGHNDQQLIKPTHAAFSRPKTRKETAIKITRKSLVTGIVHTLDLNVTEAQLKAYEQGALLQDAFPDLPAPEREFIKTGITPEEWTEHVLKAEEALNGDEEPD